LHHLVRKTGYEDGAGIVRLFSKASNTRFSRHIKTGCNLPGCIIRNFFPSDRKKWKLEKMVQNQSFWKIVGARPTAAPRNSGRDTAVEIRIIWWTRHPRILQIPSLHQVATGTPFHVPLRHRVIIITIFHGCGTNCMVPSDWDSAPPVTVPDVIAGLAVWRHTAKGKKKTTEVRLWSQLHIWFNWRIFKFFGC